VLGQPEQLTEDQVARATWLVEQAGGKDQTEAMAAKALDGAFTALGRAKLPDDVRAELCGIAEFITARQW
jgi:geranylgeranyl pyrophosphate synthase